MKNQRLLKHSQNELRIIICSNPIHGERRAVYALMEQHQLTMQLRPVFVPALFHGQPNWLHRAFARGQPITRGIEIQVTRPQAIWTMVAIVHA